MIGNTEKGKPDRETFGKCVSAGAAEAVRDAHRRSSPGGGAADLMLTGAGYDLPPQPYPDDLMPGGIPTGKRRGWYRPFPDPFLFPGKTDTEDPEIFMKM